MGGFNVVHDVLDMQLVDRHGQKIGRVDELVLELRDGAAPRLAAILVGSPLRAARTANWWARLSRSLRRVVGLDPAAVTRISFDEVRLIGNVVNVDVDGMETPALRGERWLRAIVTRVPGARSAEKEG